MGSFKIPLLNTFFIIILCSLTVSAQNLTKNSIWAVTEIPNKFVKGDDSLIYFIKHNFQVCHNSKKAETVVVYFVIEPDSSITNFEFISQNESILKSEVLEMFKKLPKWIPGIQFGKVVRSARHLLFKCDKGEVILPPYSIPSINKKLK